MKALGFWVTLSVFPNAGTNNKSFYAFFSPSFLLSLSFPPPCLPPYLSPSLPASLPPFLFFYFLVTNAASGKPWSETTTPGGIVLPQWKDNFLTSLHLTVTPIGVLSCLPLMSHLVTHHFLLATIPTLRRYPGLSRTCGVTEAENTPRAEETLTCRNSNKKCHASHLISYLFLLGVLESKT